MKKFIEKSILDELYDSKNEEFANKIQEETQEDFKSFIVEEELTKLIKNTIKDEKNRKLILNKLNSYEMEVAKEEDYWNKMFYKLGFYNSIELKRILNDKFKDTKHTGEIITFIDNCTCDFMKYIEKNKRENFEINTTYKQLLEQIEKIKVDNPNVRTFLEDKEAVPLTDVEENEVLNIIDLDNSMQIIEIKESFKLGIKETIKFLMQMNIL